MISVRVRYRKSAGHVHARFWTSEFGPETTHGLSGELTFRVSEWPAMRAHLSTFAELFDDAAADVPAEEDK